MRGATSITAESGSALGRLARAALDERSNELFVIRTDSVSQNGRAAGRGRFTAFVRG